jgi:hypothetical protein
MKGATMQLNVQGLTVKVTIDSTLEPGVVLVVVPNLVAADRLLGLTDRNGSQPTPANVKALRAELASHNHPTRVPAGAARPITRITRGSQAGRTAEYADVYAAERDGRLNVLSPAARDMIRLHFGVGGERFGYQDIAQAYGCTAHEVQDIVKRGLIQVGIEVKRNENYSVAAKNRQEPDAADRADSAR